jgi:hypothetical protein
MNLTLEIECGEFTCASEPGKFCRFVVHKNFGCHEVCLLFNVNLFRSASAAAVECLKFNRGAS